MPLAPGGRLGAYEILDALGAGGMGEVYRARDTRLERHVALKLVLEAFVADPDRAMRFEREAKTLAALNHPNIAILHGLEHAEGRHFLVMELVDGETLAQRIARHPGGLPVDEALRIAVQIAEALEAAHEKGIIHRDLKPANIKITPDDKVKVLDFGLARVNGDAGAASSMSLAHSPTFTSPVMTNAGVILGTASYMSPEQARGYAADHRSDIFSLGIVLYEMLTGRQPFPGETVSDVMASVLAREADLGALPSRVSPRLIELLKRCLEKNPKKRWQAIGDIRYELESILANPQPLTAAAQAVTVPAVPRWRRPLPYAAIAIGAALLVGLPLWYLREPAGPPRVTRFVMPMPADQSILGTGRTVLAISPDGTRIGYIASRDVFVRRIDAFEPIRIFDNAANTGINNLIFSPDGNSIAMWLGGAIVRMSLSGGPPVTICQTANVKGMSWTGDALLYASGSKILRVSANGGEPETIIELAADESPYAPRLLPDGETVLFTVAKGPQADRTRDALIVAQKPGGSRVQLIEGGSEPRYVPSGHIVFARAGVLFAIPFDASTLKVTGTPVPVLEGVRRGTAFSAPVAQYAVADDGALVYLPGPTDAGIADEQTLVFADQSGTIEKLAIPSGSYSEPRLSPDRHYIAFVNDEGREASIWVYDLKAGGSPRRLTFGGRDLFPVWSHDSTRVTFQSNRSGDSAIYWQRADGGGVAERLTTADAGAAHVPNAWSPDGNVLLFDVVRGDDVAMMMFRRTDKSVAPFGDVKSKLPTAAVFSPDGRWVAYSTRRETHLSNLLYVQPFPLTGALFQISKSNEDGHHPTWSEDGRTLYYTPGPGPVLVEVPVTLEPAFSLGTPKTLSRPFTNQPPANSRPYDAATRGRFISTVSAGRFDLPSGASDPHVVLNWFEELRAKVPVSR